MARPITVTQAKEVAAGATGSETVYKVPPARRFRVKQVELLCSAGTDLRLDIRLKYGEEVICPEAGWLTAEPGKSVACVDFTYGGGDEVVIQYRNRDTTAARTFFCTIHGELE